MSGAKETVCVTGAGGFIASWIVKMLLNKDYTVRGSVRNPEDQGKCGHLRALQGAKERLVLLRADLLDYDSLLTVIRGCHGVFHVACPLSDDPEHVIDPAVKGTRNVLDACAELGVKRVVVTSSIGAVYMDPARNPDAIIDENCWTNLNFCMQTKNWYCYAKTVAEKAAWERAKEKNWDLVVVIPCIVLGPFLQSAINFTNTHILKFLTGSAKTYPNLSQAYVDVRDVARSHILVYETPSASGRYLCLESSLHRGDLVGMLTKMFPQYPLPVKCSDEKNPRRNPYKFSNQKLTELGLSFTPIKHTLADTVAHFQEKGYLTNECHGHKASPIASRL
eukprot:Gb_15773 [translate_table: standard]